MPKTGTLTKAHIVEAVVETNGCTQKKAFETVEIMLELIKRSLESKPNILVIGKGQPGMMRSSRSLRRFLKKNDIELIEEKTSQAITTTVCCSKKKRFLRDFTYLVRRTVRA